MPHSNISIFVPHVGCPHMCAFCNQRTITGKTEIPHGDDVRKICTQAAGQVRSIEDTEIAFFGGSFTAIPREYMTELLSAAAEFVGDGKFKGIRISTRPDCIDREVLDILKFYGVTSIELGAQSMSEKVLEANGRGHNSQCVEKAAGLIKEYGFELGLQMMVGLYRSTAEDEKETWKRLVSLSPDTVRIYPTVILEGTALAELYKSGEYKTLEFDTVVDLCSEFLEDARSRGIRVIKLGLHASTDVEKQSVGGFYHPAFREICEGRIYRRKTERLINEHGGSNVEEIVISVPQRNLSKALGQKKCNTEYFGQRGINLRIVPDSGQISDIEVMEIKEKRR